MTTDTFAGRCALVTGAKRGLGFAYARALAERGCRVAITSRTPDDALTLEALVALGLLARERGVAPPIAVPWRMGEEGSDVTLGAALKAHGFDVELLVHAAHDVAPHALLWSLTPAQLGASLQRNVVGPYALLRTLCRPMARRGFGRVLVLGSLAASLGGVGQAAYIAEKAAWVGLVRAFAQELGGRNVLVNVVEPGIVATEHVLATVRPDVRAAFARRTLPQRLATVEDVVAASIGLLDPAQGFVTGQVLRVAGGADGAAALHPGDGGPSDGG